MIKESISSKKMLAFIFDVDGVIAETPHEEAWKDALIKWDIISPEYNFTEFYATHVAGEPGRTGAFNILENLHEKGKQTYFEKKQIINPEEKEKTANYFRDHVKQSCLDEHIKNSKFRVFEDALKIIFELKSLNYTLAVISSSENAKAILDSMNPYKLAVEFGYDAKELGIYENSKLGDLFAANALGTITHWHGKPVEKINHYAMAYGKLLEAVHPEEIPRIVVFEDAPKGISAVKNLGFYAVGISRMSTSGLCLASVDDLRKAGADLVYDEPALKKLSAKEIISELEKIA